MEDDVVTTEMTPGATTATDVPPPPPTPPPPTKLGKFNTCPKFLSNSIAAHISRF